MELKIYGYAARDAVLNRKGSLVSSRVYIYDEKPHLVTSAKIKNGHVTATEHMWHSAGNSFPAPYGSFIDLNWNDEPKKVLLFIVKDVDFDVDKNGDPIVGSENVEISWKRK